MIGVGGWGAGGHMQAYKDSPHAEVIAVCDALAERARQVAGDWQVENAFSDYRDLLAMPGIDAVDIATPNNTHREIALAALAAGKHVLCEKPLAIEIEHAREMGRAAREMGRVNAVNFVHRYVPSARYVKQLLDEGAVGDVHHVNIAYEQGWLTDPSFPRVWRLNAAVAGTGTLGDIGIHAADLVRWWLGDDAASVVGRLTTFRKERPTVAASATMSSVRDAVGRVAPAAEMAPVDVDDEASWLASFKNGAQCIFFSSRNATGHANLIRAEIYGSDGAIIYDNGVRNTVQASLGSSMWRRNAWATLPVPTALTREDGKNSMHYFVQDVATGSQIAPTFQDGVRAQEVLTAVERSVRERRWVDVEYD
jgi:predicted dehydrogenase